MPENSILAALFAEAHWDLANDSNPCHPAYSSIKEQALFARTISLSDYDFFIAQVDESQLFLACPLCPLAEKGSNERGATLRKAATMLTQLFNTHHAVLTVHEDELCLELKILTQEEEDISSCVAIFLDDCDFFRENLSNDALQSGQSSIQSPFMTDSLLMFTGIAP